MSEVKVNKLSPRSGTTVTIGDSGDTINIVGTLQNNGAAIPGDISSVVAGTGLSGGGTSGDVTINIEAAQPTITSLGTITTFRSTGIDDNADALAMTIGSNENIGIGTTNVTTAKIFIDHTGDVDDNALNVYSNIGQTVPLFKVLQDGAGSNVPAVFVRNDGSAGGIIIEKGGSGATANTGHNQVIIDGSSNSGMSILSGTSSNGAICFGDSGNNCIGYVNYDHSNNKIDFGTAGATQWAIDSSGNWLPAATDHGIYLGTTSAAASNLLSDYEEGTWTPIYRCTGNQLGSVTYNSLTGGEYTKVGQLVTLTGAIASDAVTLGSPSGNLRLGGLPFTVKTVGSTTATRGGVAMSNQFNWSTNHTPNNAYVVEGTTEIDLKLLYGNNDDADALASTDILTGSNTSANRLFFTLSYMTDA